MDVNVLMASSLCVMYRENLGRRRASHCSPTAYHRVKDEGGSESKPEASKRECRTHDKCEREKQVRLACVILPEERLCLYR